MLVKEAHKGIEPVGYCGHNCGYCWLGQWCGGCSGVNYPKTFDESGSVENAIKILEKYIYEEK